MSPWGFYGTATNGATRAHGLGEDHSRWPYTFYRRRFRRSIAHYGTQDQSFTEPARQESRFQLDEELHSDGHRADSTTRPRMATEWYIHRDPAL